MSLGKENSESSKNHQTLTRGAYLGIFRTSGVITYSARGLGLPPLHDKLSEEITIQEACGEGVRT
jgi:hypothetical protein